MLVCKHMHCTKWNPTIKCVVRLRMALLSCSEFLVDFALYEMFQKKTATYAALNFAFFVYDPPSL